MKHTFAHFNYNVTNLQNSLSFYEEALGLKEEKRVNGPNESFILVYLTDQTTSFALELTWLKDWNKDHYNLGDNEFHLAFVSDNFEESYQKHKQMDCICFENKEMGIYFIEDPDGYWIEIIPQR